jgi:carbamoyltransferase
VRAVVGINAFHGDAAVATVGPEGIRTALAEERLTRVKHHAGFPERALSACLGRDAAGTWANVEAIGVSRDPSRYFARKVALALRHPRSLRRSASRVKNLRSVEGISERIAAEWSLPASSVPTVHAVEHHLAHVASAFHCSPFDEAMVLTVDGFGDFVSTMLCVGRDRAVDVLQRVHYPHSLGLFYTAVTQYLGFPRYGDEYKVMGLAAYGEPRHLDAMRAIVPARRDGTFALDLSYFRHLRTPSRTATGTSPPPPSDSTRSACSPSCARSGSGRGSTASASPEGAVRTRSRTGSCSRTPTSARCSSRPPPPTTGRRSAPRSGSNTSCWVGRARS